MNDDDDDDDDDECYNNYNDHVLVALLLSLSLDTHNGHSHKDSAVSDDIR